jgi:hypothetical protein
MTGYLSRPGLSDIIRRQFMVIHKSSNLVMEELSPIIHTITNKVNKKPEPSFHSADLILLPAVIPTTAVTGVM